MEVILLEKVGRVGGIGDKVTVKPGYGRNFLIRSGKAVFATAENIAEFELRRAELEKAAAEKLKDAGARAAQLTAIASVTISAVAGEEGKLFGSVGPKDIADAFTAAGAELAKSEVKMPGGPLRELGEFSVDIQLHTEVTVAVQVVVAAAAD